MIRDAVFLARKDVEYSLRRRETLLWTFLMPVVFFALIGSVTGGWSARGDGARQRDRLAVRAAEGAGFLEQPLLRRLEEQDFEVVRPATGQEFAAETRRLTVPAGFTDALLAGKPVRLHFSRKGEGLAVDFDEIRVKRAAYTLLADVVAASEAGGGVTQRSIEAVQAAPRALKLEVRSAGRRERIPGGFEQTIPGTLVMFTMLVLLTGGAIQLVVERQQGLLRRLASAPLSRGAVVLGKWGGRMALAVVQISFAMLAGTLLFRMEWGPSLGAVAGVLLVWAAFNASLSLLLGCVARTEAQALGVAMTATMGLAALGGCWWPIEVTPGWIQALALGLPTGIAMDAMHRLISFGDGPAAALPHAAALALGAFVLGVAAARRFRFH